MCTAGNVSACKQVFVPGPAEWHPTKRLQGLQATARISSPPSITSLKSNRALHEPSHAHRHHARVSKTFTSSDAVFIATSSSSSSSSCVHFLFFTFRKDSRTRTRFDDTVHVTQLVLSRYHATEFTYLARCLTKKKKRTRPRCHVDQKLFVTFYGIFCFFSHFAACFARFCSLNEFMTEGGSGFPGSDTYRAARCHHAVHAGASEGHFQHTTSCRVTMQVRRARQACQKQSHGSSNKPVASHGRRSATSPGSRREGCT